MDLWKKNKGGEKSNCAKKDLDAPLGFEPATTALTVWYSTELAGLAQ